MTLRFGTDGMRGVANSELTPELALALGRAAAAELGADVFVIGRDTRRSGPMLEAAFAAGVASQGVEVVPLGVVPTPAVAHVAADRGWAGAMVSASHNPYRDNGIKLFAPGGLKLADAVERRLEATLDRMLDPAVSIVAERDAAPIRPVDGDLVAGYTDAVVASIDGRRLAGLVVAVDAANGAASAVAPAVLRRLGATVHLLAATPDGENINADCGSTHPEALQAAVVEVGAHVGLAFDGDADRVLAVDETGALVDGDQIIAMAAVDRRDRGVLADDTVVATVMSNLGFRLAMQAHRIAVVETAVGDRHVLEALEAGGYSLGGEQSGHVIFRDLATTGDGLLTAVQVLDLLVRSGRSCRDLASVMVRMPQILRNVRVRERDPGVVDRLRDQITAVEDELGERGRVLIRVSGTEPLVRVMVEADDQSRAEAACAELVAAVEHAAR